MHDSKPFLTHRTDFEQILQNYTISDHAKSILARTPYVVLSGVAGGGRNTVINYLVEHDNYIFVVSDTTRPPKMRDGKMEEDGVQYNFRSEEAMLDELRRGEFIEAEIIHNQQVSGTSIREIERIIDHGKIPINEMEFGGINAIAAAKPDATIIGLLPPSYEEWMRRLSSREQMSQDELHNRLVTAKKVFENMLQQSYFQFVVNTTVEEGAAAIAYIVEHGSHPRSDDARRLAGELLHKVDTVLAANN